MCLQADAAPSAPFNGQSSRSDSSASQGYNYDQYDYRKVTVYTHRRRRRLQRAMQISTGYSKILGVARFIDASIYRDTFPAIRIAILFFYNRDFFFF